MAERVLTAHEQVHISPCAQCCCAHGSVPRFITLFFLVTFSVRDQKIVFIIPLATQHSIVLITQNPQLSLLMAVGRVC